MTNTRPTTLLTGTKPFNGVVVLYRESFDIYRLSPITQSEFFGTTTSKLSAEAFVSPFGKLMYGSVSGTPFTDIWPRTLQHTTWSPGSPITRLTRRSLESGAASPTNDRKPSTAATSGGWLGGGGEAASHPPASRNTTTSPPTISTQLPARSRT